MTTQTPQRPVSHVRIGAVEAAIWQNIGKDGPYYTVTFGRRYRDEDDKPQTTQSFRLQDLLGLAKAANLSDTRIREIQDEAYEQARSAQSANDGASR